MAAVSEDLRFLASFAAFFAAFSAANSSSVGIGKGAYNTLGCFLFLTASSHTSKKAWTAPWRVKNRKKQCIMICFY